MKKLFVCFELEIYGTISTIKVMSSWSVNLLMLLLSKLLFVLRFYSLVNPWGHAERGQFA